jgi:GWxTD domain-containing protein
MTPSRRTLAFAVLALGLTAVSARADKMTKEDKVWLDSVRPLLLKDEEKKFKELKDKADREEFKKIFWARRDPDLETPENEYQAEYQKLVAIVDPKYKRGGELGSQNDCGRVFILLGEPTTIQHDQEGSGEVWQYKDNARFVGGAAEIAFNDACHGPVSTQFDQQLDRLAEQKIVSPNIDYRIAADGHLVKLVDLLPKPSPGQALLKTPRQDYPLETQVAFMKTEGGGTAAVGTVRGKVQEGMDVQDAGGKKTLKVTVVGQARGADGKTAAFAEQEEAADVRPDGTFLATFRMLLNPGTYTIKGGALETKSGKGSVAEVSTEVPNLNKGELTATLIALREVEDLPTSVVDNNNAYSGFSLAKVRLIPLFGKTFSKDDSVMLFFQFYDAQVDATTGKGSSLASVQIQKAGKTLAKAQDQPFDTVVGGNVVGPIPFKDFTPGSYAAQVKIVDNVAKKDVVKEFAFEIK